MNIFVIDDDEDARFVTRHYLQRQFSRATVLDFSNAEEALRAMETRRAGIIVTDHRLPGMSGAKFVSEIRARDTRVPIVMMSGLDPGADASLTAGVNVFLAKGSPAELGPTLHRLLRSENSPRPALP